MSSHFILFHHFRPFNSVPFHFIHSISFHVIHLIPVYLSFIPSFLYYPLFLHSIIHLFHSIPSGPIPCHALPFHPIPFIHTHSLSVYMGVCWNGRNSHHQNKWDYLLKPQFWGPPWKYPAPGEPAAFPFRISSGEESWSFRKACSDEGRSCGEAASRTGPNPNCKILLDVQTFRHFCA